MDNMMIEIFQGENCYEIKKQYDAWLKQCKKDGNIIFVHHIIPSPMPDRFCLTIGYTVI